MRVTRHESRRVSPFGHPRITVRLSTPRGLSQIPTSFIGSWYQGIHHVPLKTWPQRCSRPLCNSQHTNPHPPAPGTSPSTNPGRATHQSNPPHHPNPPNHPPHRRTAKQPTSRCSRSLRHPTARHTPQPHPHPRLSPPTPQPGGRVVLTTDTDEATTDRCSTHEHTPQPPHHAAAARVPHTRGAP